MEITKCRRAFGQTVMPVFYEVDPSDVKKQAGEFGKVFENTCNGKTEEDTSKWREALAEVATIAGEHSRNWLAFLVSTTFFLKLLSLHDSVMDAFLI